MTDYVAYYRVSIDRQGASGLGLDAQRVAVATSAQPLLPSRSSPRSSPGATRGGPNSAPFPSAVVVFRGNDANVIAAETLTVGKEDGESFGV